VSCSSSTEYRVANSQSNFVLALRSKMANSIGIPIEDLQATSIAGYRGRYWTDRLSVFASLLLCGSNVPPGAKLRRVQSWSG
jgi:hypothetical protein